MKVVVTGLGVVSSIGIGKDKFWKNLIAGKSGITQVSSFNTEGYRTHRAAEIKDFIPLDFMKEPGKKGRASQFLLAAFSMALKDSGLSLSDIPKDEVSVIAGTTMAEAQALEELNKVLVFEGVDKIDKSMVFKYPACNIPDSACLQYGLAGISVMIPTACSAGNYAVGFAYDLLKQDRAKVAFACVSDSFSRVGFSGFNRLLSMSPDICRPFDRNRKGMIIGEGAAVLLLEKEEDANARGASIYAEVLGYGLSCDASTMTAPSLEGVRMVMERAIKNSGINKGEVDYISAHGTGTISNDKIESQAIKEVFGRGYKKIPASSIKSMIGHTMGSASAMEAVSCCLTIKDSLIPPTINYETHDPECDIDCVPNEARRKKVNIAINNSYAFGGNNCCVVFKKYE
jgi:3-oxoacyl-[acyl-carrier-protein] synthase II